MPLSAIARPNVPDISNAQGKQHARGWISSETTQTDRLIANAPLGNKRQNIALQMLAFLSLKTRPFNTNIGAMSNFRVYRHRFTFDYAALVIQIPGLTTFTHPWMSSGSPAFRSGSRHP
jgi:hypothetical protein